MDKMKQIFDLARSVTAEEIEAAFKRAKSDDERVFYGCVQLISQMEVKDEADLRAALDEADQILEEYERDFAAGNVPEVPKALDQKCQNLISALFHASE